MDDERIEELERGIERSGADGTRSGPADLELMDRLSSETVLTDEDIDELAAQIDRNVAGRLASR